VQHPRQHDLVGRRPQLSCDAAQLLEPYVCAGMRVPTISRERAIGAGVGATQQCHVPHQRHVPVLGEVVEMFDAHLPVMRGPRGIARRAGPAGWARGRCTAAGSPSTVRRHGRRLASERAPTARRRCCCSRPGRRCRRRRADRRRGRSRPAGSRGCRCGRSTGRCGRRLSPSHISLCGFPGVVVLAPHLVAITSWSRLPRERIQRPRSSSLWPPSPVHWS